MAREITRRQRTAGAAVIAGAAAMALIVGIAIGSLTTADADTTTHRSEFTDKHGRVCTQVQAGPAVALDCDYKPAESRIGGLLDDLGNKP